MTNNNKYKNQDTHLSEQDIVARAQKMGIQVFGFILNISDDGCLNMIPSDNVNVLSQSLDIKPEPPSPAHTCSFGQSM